MSILSFLGNIFSIEDYGETHRILRLFGLKIKFAKREFAKKKKENPYYYYKNNNIDITTIPPATGQIRDIQLANLALLNELEYVCNKSGIKYWLDCGSLLGAVRHKGFVPWDDDIDVGMIREDYNRIIEAFNTLSRNTDMYADYYMDKNYNIIIKIRHKRCEYLFVDIFPNDFLGEHLSEIDKATKTQSSRELIKSVRDTVKKSDKIEEIQKKYYVAMSGNLKPYKSGENSDIIFGLDYRHTFRNWVFDSDIIFPLKEISFEGKTFMSVNKPKEYLTLLYRDYMSYPKKIGYGHSSYAKLTSEDIDVIRSLIGQLD